MFLFHRILFQSSDFFKVTFSHSFRNTIIKKHFKYFCTSLLIISRMHWMKCNWIASKYRTKQKKNIKIIGSKVNHQRSITLKLDARCINNASQHLITLGLQKLAVCIAFVIDLNRRYIIFFSFILLNVEIEVFIIESLAAAVLLLRIEIKWKKCIEHTKYIFGVKVIHSA